MLIANDTIDNDAPHSLLFCDCDSIRFDFQFQLQLPSVCLPFVIFRSRGALPTIRAIRVEKSSQLESGFLPSVWQSTNEKHQKRKNTSSGSEEKPVKNHLKSQQKCVTPRLLAPDVCLELIGSRN